MITQSGLSLTDRINLRQLLTIGLKNGEPINLEQLSQEERIALTHWWQVNHNQNVKDKKVEDILEEINAEYKDKPDGLVSDLQYTLETDPTKDAFVDAALTKALVDDMRSGMTANDVASKTQSKDTNEIIAMLIKRKQAELVMERVRQNRLQNQEINKSATQAVEHTDPRLSSTTPSSAGSFGTVLREVQPVIDSLSAQSGVQITPIQREIIATQIASMAAAGALDLSNAQQLSIHFAVSASEVSPEYAATNPIGDLYQHLDEVVRNATDQDVDTSLQAAADNKRSQDDLKMLNQAIGNSLLNSSSPEVAGADATKITVALTEYVAKNPDATAKDLEDFVNDKIKAQTGQDGQIQIDGQALKNLTLIDHRKTQETRTTYATLVIGDVLSKTGAEIDPKKVSQIAQEIALQTGHTKQTDAETIEQLSHRLSQETGVDQEKIKSQLEPHIAEIQRLKQLNHSLVTVNIPAGIAIDTEKIVVKNEAEIKRALAKTLSDTKNLSPKDIDRILSSKDLVDRAVKNLSENKDFQVTVRKIDTSAIYSKEQNEIYKAFFEAYKDEVERSRPTQRGVETIVLISTIPHQTVISPTAVALANMGVTTEMFDKLIKDPSKSPSFQTLLKNHKNQMALLRDQLEQLEGSRLHQDLAPDRLDQMNKFMQLSTRDAALVGVGGSYGKTLAKTYNSTIVQIMGQWAAPQLYPALNVIFHPIDKVKDYFAGQAAKAIERTLFGGKVVAEMIGQLLVKGLAKLGINLALGAATAGVGFVISFVADKLLKPLGDLAKDVFGEKVTLKDALIAPLSTFAILMSGLGSLLGATSILSSGVLGTFAASAILGLFMYITSFVMAPILSTIVHLESGSVGSATQPYTGKIIEGCNPIWPVTPARPSGKVIQGPKGTFSHTRVEAVDITAPVGSQVVSVSNGTISFNDYYNVYGNNVRIRSVAPNGAAYEVWYGHLAAPSPLNVGDTVKIGDPIALSGATSSNANFANPHLHLEYRGMLYNTCPAGGVQIPIGCYGFTDCGSVYTQ
jgi:hypothetical protein